MTNIFSKKFLGAIVVMALLLGFVVKPAFSQAPSVLVGKTEEQSSQLIFWYDNVFNPLGRSTFIQVTNASPDPVNVHVQIFQSFCLGPISPGGTCLNPKDNVLRCIELDFDDFYTGLDTHIYDLSNIFRNSDIFFLNPVASVDGTKGFIVITPINNPAEAEAISHNHLFGTAYLFDANAGTFYAYNAMGRDAVSFTAIPPGLPVPDGTLLDGIDAGFILLRPDILKFNFADSASFFEPLLEDPFIDVVSIAFKDNYDATFGRYEAEPSEVQLTGDIIDDLEFRVSGCAAFQNCFFDIGLNRHFAPANPLLDDGFLLCAGNDFPIGWVRLDVDYLDDVTNEIGMVGIIGDVDPDLDFGFGNSVGGAKYMHVE